MAGRVSILHVITKLAVGGSGMNTLISCRDIGAPDFVSELVTGPEKAVEGDYFDLARKFGITTMIAPHLFRRISPLNDLLAVGELAGIIRKGRYAIVHTHGSKARFVGRLAARLSGCRPRVVQTFHGWPFDFNMSLPVQAACTAMERIGFGLACESVAVTPEDIFKGVAWGVGKPHDYTVIRSGVEFGRFRDFRGTKTRARELLGVPGEGPVVGTVARLAPVKDPMAFIGVAELVLERFPGSRFVIVGDGPMRYEVERRIAGSGASSRIILAGNRNDVERLLPALDVFLITSRSEGLPRGMLEALAAGVPVVSTDVGGVCELLTGERNGLIRPVGDVKGLADAVCGILASPELPGRLLRNVDTDLEPFSAEKMVADLKELYLSMACGPARGPQDNH